MDMLQKKWVEGKFVCAGIDTDFDKIPESAKHSKNGYALSLVDAFIKFNKAIVDATNDFVCAYKLNVAFYEAYGDEGILALYCTMVHIQKVAPDVPVILDAKRADIGNTNAGYVKFAFDYLKADAITVHPYLGQEALMPFLDCKDKGVIVLCRTSNPCAGEFQDLEVLDSSANISIPLYQIVARQVATKWNTNGNCAVVVGATYPEELAQVRAIIGNMPILIPGIGAQGGDLEKAVTAGKNSRGQGMIINSSRGIIFASKGPDFAEAARLETLKFHVAISNTIN
jgi:orotidine-5'-phosphate decarboxylase